MKKPTIQEEIKKEVRDIIDDNLGVDYYEHTWITEEGVEKVFEYLHSKGVVLWVKKECTSKFICDDYMNGLGWLTEHERIPTGRELDRFITALGYIAYEPLITV